jgi:hypothetical protein
VSRADHLELVVERLARLTREADALVRAAELNRDGQAVVTISSLNRLRRELRGEPQPSTFWMSVS